MNSDQQRLCEENIKLVYAVINTKYPTLVTDEDIAQAGMIGLCLAAENWDENRSKFSTFAWNCISNEIYQELKRRNKYSNDISLNTKIAEDMKIEDKLIGESDVDYVDTTGVMRKLSPREKEVFELLQRGLSAADVTKHMGWSRHRTNACMRKIKSLWRMTYG